MNTDIRLSVGFWLHPKTRRLAKRLGLEAVRSLQILWLWAAQNRPDGNLSGLDEEDIELAADWQGEEKAFFTACLGAWIDEIDGGYVLHDWAEHNPWQAEAEARSDAARKAALARWGNAPASKTHMRKQCARNAPASDAQCPSPFPIQEDNNIYTPPVDNPVNEDPARSLERPTGGDGEKPSRPDGESSGIDPAVDLDGPGIEFMELRDAYNAVRPEGPLAGFPEYKQLKASRDRTGRSRYPGNARLIDDFTRRMEAGFWNPGYALGLAQYLKTRLWEQPVKARAAPQRTSPAKPGEFDPDRQAQIFRDVLADLEAEDARAGQATQAGGPVRLGPELRQGIPAASGATLDAPARAVQR